MRRRALLTTKGQESLIIVYTPRNIRNKKNAEIAAYLKNAYPNAPTSKRQIVEISEDVYYQGDPMSELNGKVVGFSLGYWGGSESIFIATENWKTTYYKTHVLLYDGETDRKAGSTDSQMWD